MTTLTRTVMRSLRLALPFLLVFVTRPVAAQRSEILRLPGRTVEVTGLERWTIQMLQDSLAKYSPGDSLQSHACAAVLRYKLHFADASSTTFMGMNGPGDTTRYTLVHVIEPQDSARVHHLTRPIDTLSRIPEWADVVQMVQRNPDAARYAWMLYGAEQQQGAGWRFPGFLAEDSSAVRAMQRWLLAHRTPRDRAKAHTVLAESPSMFDQIVAISILQTFPREDSTWVALVRMLRLEDGWAPGFAASALQTMASAGDRPSSWAPVAADIHAILDGTSLFNLDELSRTLVKAGVDSTMARPFLAGGGHALLARAVTCRPAANSSARALLRALYGRDPGTDPAEWRQWIAALDAHP
ncbi:MAG TPA: hypothetical protein VL295_02120 [Gemmatimonadales bacterium]|nr:hypothetical protein [Gemmatimonadales bacterium]